MKTKIFSIVIVLFISIGMISQNTRNTYTKQWQQVEDYQKQSLPKSAIKEVEAILQQAIGEKNTPQVMKAYVYLNDLNYKIDTDHDFNYIGKLEDLIKNSSSVTDKALIHSVLADLYFQHYDDDRWTIDDRTNLADDIIPDDIKEWTVNNYINKIYQHLQAAIKDKTTLEKDVTKSYDDIIDLGPDSRIYRPSLYDFVMWRTIETAKKLMQVGREEFDPKKIGADLDQLQLPAKDYIQLNIKPDERYIIFDFYKQYFSDLQKRGLTNSIVLLELDKLNYINSLSYRFNREKRLTTLYELEKLYDGNETTVEIIDQITNELAYNIHYSRYVETSANDDGITTEQKIYDWLQKGITKYPNYIRISALKNKLTQMQTPTMRVEGNSLFYSTDKIEMEIIFNNPQLVKRDKALNLYRLENKSRVFVKSYPVNFSSRKTYEQDTTKLDLGILPYGEYELVSNIDANNKDANTFKFCVSDLMTYYASPKKGVVEIFVVSRKNGNPVKNTKVTIFKTLNKKKEILAQLTTDELGLVSYEYPVKENSYNNIGNYTVTYNNDKALPEEHLYASHYSYDNYSTNQEDKYTISCFTDRSIYRPGQTVHFKAIVLDKDSKAVSNNKQTIQLYNQNNDLVTEQTLVTNEYGSIAGEFVLPQNTLLGSYHIENEDQDLSYFRVEEYKRPTFEVKFDKIEKTYTFGEKITLKGSAKTYSGISLQDAKVTYRISRQPFSFWFWRSANESHFQDGIVNTKEDGTFEIEFTPNAGDGYKLFGQNIYTFNITADITDLNGETRSGNYSITVGDVSMVLNVSIPNQIEKSQELNISIDAKNLDGADIQTEGTYTIYTLDKNDSIQTKLAEGEFKTGKQNELANKIKSLPSGKLRIIVKGKDDKNKEVSSQAGFVLFSYNDKKPPYETNIWLVEKESTFKGDKPAEIIYGTSRKDAYILYQLYNNQQVFERKFVRLDNRNQTFTIPYQEGFKDEVYASFTTIKDGQLRTSNVLLKKEEQETDTQLNIKLNVFRDKLRPGQEETWTLSIFDKEDKPVSAEVLASMYDTSLDQIYPFTAWMLNRPYIDKPYLKQLSYRYTNNYKDSYYLNFNHKSNILGVYHFQYDKFAYGIAEYAVIKQEMEHFAESVDQVLAPTPRLAKSASANAIYGARSTDMIVIGYGITDEESDEHGIDIAELSEEKVIVGEGGSMNNQSAPQVRRNFNETAFFFPQLRTNEEGETVISFTVPESNTTWRFRAFAHDKDSKVGTLERMVVTRKELMVTPNMPRFIRHGDKTSISTKISNLSENSISGEVSIEFFNPIDEKIVDLKVKDNKQKFAIDKDASTSATWTFDVPTDIDLLGVRIVAQSEYFSDGEQHALAVLPNRMLVTETMPFDVTEKGEQNFVFDKLANNKSKTLDNYKLTLEFASNPAWYAVQALPVMSNPTNENAVSWFASYYVNKLGASLMKQYPKIANVIEAWTKQGGDKETLISKLNKNEELKTILQEETPWVLDAKSETEQMQRLALLFDLNNTKYKTETAISKLQELQKEDGGWSWYKGLYSNRSVTQYLLYGLAELQTTAMIEYREDVKKMQMNALKYVDLKIVEDFKNLKKYNSKWKDIKSIPTYQLEYLYMRAMYRDIPISKEAREAERFYIDVVSKYWTNISLYEKSLLAVLAQELGQKDLAAKITKSIREHAVESKELGMYWPNNKNSVFLSLSAVSTHTFMMEALKANGATTEEMDMMKRWLVKQKQTQVWESTHATIDAINALIKEGSDWLSADTQPTIKVGGKTIEPENKELATGYFKTAWDKSEIKNNMAKVNVSSTDSKPAYGALYWQYYENLDKISKQGGSLNVEKELYREVIAASGRQLDKITEDKPLKVGDKVIVRLVVRTDRDMEFVQLKDMRASCFEPVMTISGTDWQNNVLFYHTTKDASTNFFIDVLPKGTYVFEYPVYVNRSGEYSNGITSIQCAYAPEFTSQTAGIKVKVTE